MSDVIVILSGLLRLFDLVERLAQNKEWTDEEREAYIAERRNLRKLLVEQANRLPNDQQPQVVQQLRDEIDATPESQS